MYRWADGRDPEHQPLAELPPHIISLLLARRDDGFETIAPPSTGDRDGSAYGLAALDREVAAVAGASEGTRNETLNRAAFSLGQLVASGALKEGAVFDALICAATSAGLDASEARATIRSGLRAGSSTPRRPDQAVRRPAIPGAPTGKPRIIITLDVRGVVDQALAAMITKAGGVYQRGDNLVRIVRETGRPRNGIIRVEGALTIAHIADAGLLELLTDSATWIEVRATRKGNVEEEILPPNWARNVFLARRTWPGLPWLEGIVSAPTMRSDGSILDQPGYDAQTGLLLDTEGIGFPSIKARPTQDDAKAAMVDLAEPFVEFPFADQDTGLSACIAAVLTIVGRHAFDGPAPLFAIRSTTPGSGKDLMACAISIMATGREPARTTAPRGKDADGEWRKRILAHALAGDTVILIGNVEAALGSPTLADTLTRSSVTERILGESRNVTVPISAVWLCTGNGLTFRGDLGRRVVPIDLDPCIEHPEDRTGPRPGTDWSHPDLLSYVRERRPHVVGCALTILRAFQVAGRPAHGKPLKGSFEAWDRLVRAAVIWVTNTDPLNACEAIREEADTDLDGLRAGLVCWHDAFGVRALTAAEAVGEAKQRASNEIGMDSELVTALAGLVGCDVVKLDGRSLGNSLRRVKGRPVDGLRFVLEGRNRRRKVARWVVEGEVTA